MDKAAVRTMLKGFDGGPVGALVAGLASFCLASTIANQEVTAGTLVAAAVGTGIGLGLTEQTDGT
ncbi:hypothetical protein [Halococcus sp. AFM35]|uniref:hypothetical protein n=1 Tax=Halococcus sp. AFM35 TaxID=3421653 RepID=UPI003EBDD7CA